MLLRTPLGRLAFSVLSWLAFSFCLTLLWLSSVAVIGLGGFCASGGPYVIQTECPAAVVWATPVSIFGGLIAVGIGVLAGGFGLPLASWAWPALFGSLGVAFFFGAATGSITFLLLGILFVIMGAVPLVLALRAAPQRTVLGTTSLAGVRFAEHPATRPSLTSRQPVNPDGAVPPTAADWALGLLVPLIAAGVGIWLGLLVLHAG